METTVEVTDGNAKKDNTGSHSVSVSSGDSRWEVLRDMGAAMGDAAHEIAMLKDQMEKNQGRMADMGLQCKALKRENQVLKKALESAEKGTPLNHNDELMLRRHQVEIHFMVRFTSGAVLKAVRNGRTLTEVRGPETAALLPELMEKLRRKLRSER